MSSIYKVYVESISIYSKYSASEAVGQGIMGRLGKFFGVRLNFF